jgi:hypothetical protein
MSALSHSLVRIVTYLASIAAVAVILAILHDAFEVMLLPRRVKSKTRIVRYFFEGTWTVWRATVVRLPRSWRDDFLASYGPLSLVALLLVWAACLITAFGALYWALGGESENLHVLLQKLYFSGVTFFTLGYGDYVPQGTGSKVVSVLEAGTGFGFIAMVIGYLPVLYQLFSRREAQVIVLDSVAGSPPKAVTLLSRHAEGRSLDHLDNLFVRWQQWSAELLESQLSYPMLAYYRSQHDNQSWLATLAAVMDAAVLVMTGMVGVPTFQARLTFATARLAVIEMGRVLGAKPRAFEEDRLTHAGFETLQEQLSDAGLLFVDEDEAEERLAAFRSTYEPFLNGLAYHLLLPLPNWEPIPDQIDNWANNPRGRTALRLMENVPAEPEV